ncbi:hypothetical protein BJ973_009631 [Actinoplanes tereljensis]|uniref:Uncharacterized protein n=1 Tax=Paractinoplanes tereljensis TaxID=571912 RepID=A0A919TPN7_9ACTN|nr:hypothetical protein [Actinoplanes tereljensis]GIF17406.1 hypothetical protein Ate02nite_01360 [Actinoplanes tereljensis]
MRLYTAIAAAALLIVAGPAPAGATGRYGLRLQSATVLPGGSAVDLHYIATCPPGAFADIGVSIAQRTGSHVAVGTGSTGIVCNGLPRSVLLRVAATGGGVWFRPGRARATAGLRAVTGLGVVSDDDRARLKVMRR